MVCLVLSILCILSRSTEVEMSLLGSVTYSYYDRKHVHKKKNIFVEVINYPQARMVEGTLILSLRNSLDYFNSANLRKKIDDFLNDAGPFLKEDNFAVQQPDKLVLKRKRIQNIKKLNKNEKQSITIILDFSHVIHCDSASCFTLQKMVHTFQKQSVQIIFTGVRPALSELLTKGKVLQELGESNQFITVEEAIEKLKETCDDPSIFDKKQSMTFHQIIETKRGSTNNTLVDV